MSDKSLPNDATVQMSPEDVARLHDQLAAKSAGGAGGLGARPAPRPTPRPATSQAASGGPAMIGGIGAALLLVGLILAFIPKLQGAGDDAGTAALAALTAGYIALALGLFGTAARTSALGVVAGIFSMIVGLIFALALLGDLDILAIPGLLFVFIYGVAFGPALVWLLVGLWALSGVRRLSNGIGVAAGAAALIGALASGAAYSMMIMGVFEGGPDDTLFMVLDIAGTAGMAGAAVAVAMAFFGPIAKAGQRA